MMLAGCAYFNTYYMAQKSYKDAELELERSRYMINANTKKMYNDAIARAADLIRDYPTSKYVDDSLYLIGMSYYKMGEFSRAETKYREILDAFPESEYIPDARYYLAMSLIELNDIENARLILSDIFQNGNRSEKGRAGLAFVEIAMRQELWEDLLTASQNVIDADSEDKDRQKAMVSKGIALSNLERYDEAVQTLSEVLDEKLEPRLQVEASLQYSLSMAELGRYDEGLGYLENMLGRGEFQDYDANIRLQIGKINEIKGNDEVALETFRNLAGTYPDSTASKEAWYRVGILTLKDLSLADEAREAFSNVSTVKVRNAVLDNRATTIIAQIDSMKARIEDIKKYEDDPMSRAHARFQLAELLSFSFDRPDSAIAQYRQIIEEVPDSDYAVRSEYFIGYHTLRMNDSYTEEKDRELMRSIIEKYPDQRYSQELRVYLGELERSDEDQLFAAAEDARLGGESPDVYIPLYEEITDRFKDTEMAYQARFIIAYCIEHYTEDKDRAMTMYQELADEDKNFRNRKYVDLAEEKLEFAKKEPDLIKDSVKAVVYLTYGTGRDNITGSSGRRPGETSNNKTDTVAGGLTGYQKIRARNARIRSRYFTN